MRLVLLHLEHRLHPVWFANICKFLKVAEIWNFRFRRVCPTATGSHRHSDPSVCDALLSPWQVGAFAQRRIPSSTALLIPPACKCFNILCNSILQFIELYRVLIFYTQNIDCIDIRRWASVGAWRGVALVRVRALFVCTSPRANIDYVSISYLVYFLAISSPLFLCMSAPTRRAHARPQNSAGCLATTISHAPTRATSCS